MNCFHYLCTNAWPATRIPSYSSSPATASSASSPASPTARMPSSGCWSWRDDFPYIHNRSRSSCRNSSTGIPPDPKARNKRYYRICLVHFRPLSTTIVSVKWCGASVCIVTNYNLFSSKLEFLLKKTAVCLYPNRSKLLKTIRKGFVRVRDYH